MEIAPMSNDKFLYNARKTVVDSKTRDNVMLLIHDLKVFFDADDDYLLMDLLQYWTGISDATAWRLVKEKKMPHMSTLEKIAKRCGLRVTLQATPESGIWYVSRNAKQSVNALTNALMRKGSEAALSYRPQEMTLFMANMALFHTGKFVQVRLLRAPGGKASQDQCGLSRADILNSRPRKNPRFQKSRRHK